MLKFTLTFCLSILFVQLYGQIEAITTNGKKVLLFEDGTWKYVNTNRIHSIDCMQLTSIAEDTTTGRKYISSSGNIFIPKNEEKGFEVSIKKIFSEEYTGVYFKVIGGGCISDNPMIEILFRDGTKSSFFAPTFQRLNLLIRHLANPPCEIVAEPLLRSSISQGKFTKWITPRKWFE